MPSSVASAKEQSSEMQLHEDAGPSSLGLEEAETCMNVATEGQQEAIFTCRFPGCTRQYASTDAVSVSTELASPACEL